MIKKTIAAALCALVLCAPAMAADKLLRDGHPSRYTVQPGDTLWDISDRFLTDPWKWPEIWYDNPSIENPHLIYPGDVVRLTTVDGETRLTIERGGGTVKLSPKIRTEDLNEAISTIPVGAIRPFLTGHRVVAADAYEEAPYILASADERVMASAGDPVYVRGLPESPVRAWDVLRRGKPFVDPESRDVLGFEATNLGSARLENDADPATFVIAGANREILPGDRLFRAEDAAMQSRFYPRAPDAAVEGVIMAVMDGVSQVGQFDVVAVNRGAGSGLGTGNVLEIYKRGRTVKDEYADDEKVVTLPDEKAGELILFRVFDRMSFGLVMEARRAMEVDDLVRSP